MEPDVEPSLSPLMMVNVLPLASHTLQNWLCLRAIRMFFLIRSPLPVDGRYSLDLQNLQANEEAYGCNGLAVWNSLLLAPLARTHLCSVLLSYGGPSYRGDFTGIEVEAQTN